MGPVGGAEQPLWSLSWGRGLGGGSRWAESLSHRGWVSGYPVRKTGLRWALSSPTRLASSQDFRSERAVFENKAVKPSVRVISCHEQVKTSPSLPGLVGHLVPLGGNGAGETRHATCAVSLRVRRRCGQRGTGVSGAEGFEMKPHTHSFA